MSGRSTMDYARRPRRWARFQRYLLVGVVLVGGAVGMNVSLSRWAPQMPTVDRRTVVIDTVQRGDMVHDVRAIGKLAAEYVMWIPAVTEGRVARIAMLPGTQVTVDALLIELSNPDVHLGLVEARSVLESARAELKSKKADLENMMLTLQSELVTLQTDHDLAVASYEVTQSLFERKVVTDLQLKLDKLKAEGLAKRLEVQTARFESFCKSLPDQYAIYEARVDQAEAMLELQQNKVNSLAVKSGIVGVLEQVPVEVGQQVAAGEPLARVVNANKLKGELKIPEVQARYVETGQTVEIDTRHGVVTGTVSRIDPAVQEGTVVADVSLNGPLPAEARPELSVVGTIEIERLVGVLYVGRPVAGTAVTTIGLFKVDPSTNTAVRVPVQIGVASISHVEVRDGLRSGDQVILTDMSRFDEVDQIRLE